MGEKLALYYQYIKKEAGPKGQISLAQETKIPLTEAAVLSDTPEHIRLFKKAIEKITAKPAPDL